MGETTKLINAKMVLDATGYNNSIKGVNAETKKYQSQIKAASEGVKTFGKDSEKLGSIQQALSKTIEAQNKKIEIYKKSIEDTNQKMQNNIQTRDKLKASLDQANKKYDEAVKMYGKESKEAQKAKEEVDKLSTEHKKSEKAIESNAKQVQKYETDLNKANAEMQKTHGELNKVNKELDNGNNKWLVASEGLKKHGEKLQEIGGHVSGVGDKILKLSAPLVAVGGIGGKLALDFEDGMANINTLLDDTSHLESYKNAILNLSNEYNINSKIMQDGMYQTISSLGDMGKETEEMFSIMAKSAKAGGAEVADSVSLISAGMKGYGNVSKETAGKISDLAFITAKLGVTTFPEMAKSMQPLFPLSSTLNLSMEELFGSMATLTGVTGNTSEVTTQLKAVFSNLIKPTKDMAELIEKYGYSNAQAMLKSKGFIGTLDILKQETGGNVDQLGKLFSSTEALTGVSALLGGQYDNLVMKTNEMTKATGATNTAFDKTANTTGEKLRGNLNKLKNEGIRLGEALMPVMESGIELLGKVTDKISGLSNEQLQNYAKWGMLAVASGGAFKVIGGGITVVGKVASGLSKLTGVLGASKIATAGLGTAAKVAGGVGGLGALGAGLGSTLLAIAPWAAAIVGGVVVVKKLHNALHDTGTEVDLFADKVTATYTNVETASGTMQQAVKQETLTISEETKKQVESYLDLDNQAKMAIDDLYINSTKITQDQCSNITQQYSTMTKTVVDGLEKNKQEQLTSLTEFFKNSNSISATEEEEILKNTQKYFADKQKIVTDGNTEITKIMQDAANNHRELTEDEKNKINTIQKEMKDQAVLTLSKNEEEAAVILSRMAAYDGKITKEQASEHIKTLNKSRDDAVQTANDECSKRIAQIEKLRDEAGIISKDQASKLIKDAEKTRDDTVKAAEDTRYKAIEKIRGMYDGIDDQVDTRTGKIIDAWDRVKRWWNEWKPETKTLTVRENYVSSQDTDIIGGRKPTNRWTGDRNFQGGLTYLNERGYELYDLPQGTRIYNHDASEEIVLNTAREVAEQVASKMIGGSKGTGINVTQNIYNTVSTPSEIARQTKNNLRELGLSF